MKAAILRLSKRLVNRVLLLCVCVCDCTHANEQNTHHLSAIISLTDVGTSNWLTYTQYDMCIAGKICSSFVQ